MKTVVIPPIKQGAYWKGIPLVTYTENGKPVRLAGARIRMHLRKKHDSPGEPALAWDSEDASIRILDEDNGQFQVEGKVFSIEPGGYVSDVEVTIGGRPQKILDFSWTVSKSATR